MGKKGIVRILRGDIVLVPFKFSDLSNTKFRPVLVISENKGNKNKGCEDFTALQITSNIEKNAPYLVMVDPAVYPETNLRSLSAVNVSNIQRLEKSFVRANIGKMPHDLMEEIDKYLISSLGIKNKSA